ncbi:MAG: hypothetical protein J6B64_00790 [Bacilli bacterium]|nr:hypothetical protein [Bacilli bacterium]MBP3635408.1 hypothetical protein [Bacilli bacterium]
MNDKVISFPILADYNTPIKFMIEKMTNYEVRLSPKMTKNTLEIGSKYSPDYACLPFKYTLGNYIETLENGANVIMQAGGGCRFGYYFELQKQILSDLGYNFEFYSLTESDVNGISSIYKTLKNLNPNIKRVRYLYYLLLTFLMIYYMDKLDMYIRKNVGFEINKGSFDRVKKSMLTKFSKTRGFLDLIKTYYYYRKKFKNIALDKPKNCLKVGIVGELYTSMEPHSSYFIERELANMNVEVTRYTNVTFLLITKRFKEKYYLRKIKKYCKFTMGADAMDNVARAKILIKKGYDGIIHIKPFGCVPEIGAMKVLENLCDDEKIPIMFLTFDTNTSELGIKTRLEAFHDMLLMRRGNEK